jgi:hypothetical protein
MGSLIKGWLKWQLVPDAFRITHCGVRKVVLSCGVDRLKYIDHVPRAYAQPRTQAINARPPRACRRPAEFLSTDAIKVLGFQLGLRIIRKTFLEGERSDRVTIERYRIVKPTRESGNRSRTVTGL